MFEVLCQFFHLGILLLLRREEGVPCGAAATRTRQRIVAVYTYGLVVQYEMKRLVMSAVYSKIVIHTQIYTNVTNSSYR